jgi:hypothetical protein
VPDLPGHEVVAQRARSRPGTPARPGLRSPGRAGRTAAPRRCSQGLSILSQPLDYTARTGTSSIAAVISRRLNSRRSSRRSCAIAFARCGDALIGAPAHDPFLNGVTAIRRRIPARDTLSRDEQPNNRSAILEAPASSASWETLEGPRIGDGGSERPEGAEWRLISREVLRVLLFRGSPGWRGEGM